MLDADDAIDERDPELCMIIIIRIEESDDSINRYPDIYIRNREGEREGREKGEMCWAILMNSKRLTSIESNQLTID